MIILPTMRSMFRPVAASGFSPADLGPIGWYRSDSGTFSDAGVTAATNLGTVQQWSDLSGNGRHVAQATAGNRPVYKTAIINGHPVLEFDGTNDFLSWTAGLTALTARTVYVAANYLSLGSSSVYLFDGWTSTNRSGVGANLGTRWSLFAGSDLLGPAASAVTGWRYHSGVFDGSSSVRRVNAVTQATGSPGSHTLIDWVVGSGRQGTSFWSNAQIAEVIVYPVAHNSTQYGQVESYLAARYGL